MSNGHLSLYQQRLEEKMAMKNKFQKERYTTMVKIMNSKKDETVTTHENPQKDENPKTRNHCDLVVVIPVFGRHYVLKKVIQSLKQQTMTPAVLCVVSNETDRKFCADLNVDICKCPNRPLGRKFQAGVTEAKKYNPKAVMILGSDDLLSYTYVEKTMKLIDKQYDFIGIDTWYIVCSTKECYIGKYVNKHAQRFLGAGRTYSRRFLNTVKWKVFSPTKNSNLDQHGEDLASKHLMRKIKMKDNTFVFSLKGDWPMLHTIDDMRSSKSFMSLKRITLERTKLMISTHLKTCLIKPPKKPITVPNVIKTTTEEVMDEPVMT